MKALRDFIRSEIEPFADDIRVDALGNLIAHKGNDNKTGSRIMLSAHMDEIGVIATHIDEHGFIRFNNIGGVRPHYCMGGRVRFVNGVQGVIGHDRLLNSTRVPSLDKLFIDVGATSREDCPIHIGDIAAFERPFLDLGDRIVAKAMDDRISVAVLIEVMKEMQDSPHELFFVFSVQEEVGLRGATTAAFSINPDIGLSVDVTLTGDTPKGYKMAVELGKGPAIKVRDAGMLSDPRLVRLIADTAEAEEIPHQFEVLEGGTTDAKAIQLTQAGVVAGCVSIPSRYVHSPSEMVDYRDVQNTIRLLVKLLEKPIDIL